MITQPLAAETACAEAGLSFARTFRAQCVFSQSPALALETFRCHQLGDWHLHHCRSLPYARLYDEAGDLCAILIGIGIDASGARITDGRKLAPGETPETLITGTAGRYLLFTPAYVYSDPTGSMGGVYDPETRTVASTVLMCLDRPQITPPGFNAEAILAGRGTYSLGYTSDHAVRKITPNHRLSLAEFTQTRFWPAADQKFTRTDPDALISSMALRLSDVIGAVARSTPTILPLSGGRDSRNLAACAKPHRAHIAQSYTHVMNWQSSLDAEIATQIAARLDLPHTTLTSYRGDTEPRRPVSPKARQRRRDTFRLAGGFVGDANNDVLDGLSSETAKGVVLRGNVMEILKANHWKRGHVFDRRHPDGIDFDYATARLAIDHQNEAAVVARFRPEYEAWYATLPPRARKLHYDFAFVEHLLPGWQTKFFGYTRNFLMNPFSDRALIEACMRLPVRERQANRYNDALLAHCAPELVGIPFTRDLKLARQPATPNPA